MNVALLEKVFAWIDRQDVFAWMNWPTSAHDKSVCCIDRVMLQGVSLVQVAVDAGVYHAAVIPPRIHPIPSELGS